MNTDAAILTLLADLQRDKAALQQRVHELEQQLNTEEWRPGE